MDKVEPINLISQGLTTRVRAAKFEIDSIIAALVPAQLLNILRRQQTGAGVTHKQLNEHLCNKGLSFRRYSRRAWLQRAPPMRYARLYAIPPAISAAILEKPIYHH